MLVPSSSVNQKPLNSNQKNGNFFSKKWKKMKKMFPKMKKTKKKQKKNKHYESQVENKLVSKHNKYRTLAYFITNNLYVL